MPRLLRYHDGFVPNTLALGYGLAGYAGGLLLITSDSILLVLPGVFLLAHALVIAAYRLHERAHNTIFRDNRLNARLQPAAGGRDRAHPPRAVHGGKLLA